MDCTPQRPRFGSSALKRGQALSAAGNQKGEGCLQEETPLKLGRRVSRGAPKDQNLDFCKPQVHADVKCAAESTAPSGLDAIAESDDEMEVTNVVSAAPAAVE